MTPLQIIFAAAAFDAGCLLLWVCCRERDARPKTEAAPRPEWLPMSPDQVAAEVDELEALWRASTQ